MKKRTAPLHIDRNNCHLTLDNVPACICSQCGEACFEENEVRAGQDLITAVDQKTQPLAVTP